MVLLFPEMGPHLPAPMQVDAARKLKEKLEEAGKALVPLPGNLVDAVWGKAMPAPPAAKLRVHALQWAGQAVAEKLDALRGKLEGACSVCEVLCIGRGLPDRALSW